MVRLCMRARMLLKFILTITLDTGLQWTNYQTSHRAARPFKVLALHRRHEHAGEGPPRTGSQHVLRELVDQTDAQPCPTGENRRSNWAESGEVWCATSH